MTWELTEYTPLDGELGEYDETEETMTLTEMRDDLVNLELQIKALLKAQGETKKAAKVRYTDYCNGDPDAHSDLKAFNNVYANREAEIKAGALRLDTLREQIAAWYAERKPLDWTYRLIPGSLWDGWGCRNREGRLFIVDKELQECEIEALKMITKFPKLEIERAEGGYRLRARVDLYRGV